MIKSSFLTSLLAATLLAPASMDGMSEAHQDLAKRYIRLQFQERSRDIFDLLSEDFDFSDPTAEFWGGAPGGLVAKGRASFERLHDSWNLEASRLDQEHLIFVGEYAIAAGKISWKNAQQPNWIEDVPFATVLRMQGEHITERRDYGQYDAILPEPPAHKKELLMAAEAYMEAYVAMDLEALDGMLGEKAVMVDPTAGGEPVERDELLARVEKAKERIAGVSLQPSFTLSCGRHVLYLGTGSVKLRSEGGAKPKVVEYPYLVVLEFKEGAVVEHRRYLDHGAVERMLQRG